MITMAPQAEASLLPEPLRITKRKTTSHLGAAPPSAGHLSDGPSGDLHRSGLGATPGPADASDHVEAIHQHPFAPDLLRQQDFKPLHVRKQRQSGADGGYPAGDPDIEEPGILHHHDACLTQHSNIDPPHSKGTGKSSSSGIHQTRLHDVVSGSHPKSVPVRAVTTGSLVKNMPSIPARSCSVSATPIVLNAKQQRHGLSDTSNNATRHTDVGCQREPKLERKPSIRDRIVSKVVSGLITKKFQLSHPVMERRRGVRPPDEASHSGLVGCNHAPAARRRSDTVSSIASDSATSSELERTLLLFPTPPNSNVTSPTTLGSHEQRASLEGACSNHRVLCDLNQNIIMAAEVNVTAESERLWSDSEQTVLLAIELKGVLCLPKGGIGASVQSKALQVVVIIDNS